MLRWIRKTLQRLVGSSTSSPASWFVDWIRGDAESDSGIAIDGKSCLRYAPVWNAVNRICGRVAQLPLQLHEWQDVEQTRKLPAVNHPAYRLMRREPNVMMTPAVFKELMQYHALIWGNGRAEIVRNERADPVALIPLLPGQTKTVLVNGIKWHVTQIVVDESGRTESCKIRDENCLHIPGLGYDGIAGYALVDIAKNSWGLGLSQEKRANRFYRNNAVPGLILEAPPGVFSDDDEARKFLKAFREMHEGLDNTSRTGLLRNGITAKPLSLTDRDSQTIEQRTFQRQEVALWFMLETILGDGDSESYNSLEQKQLAELINCLNLWLVKWQEECARKLLREREKAADSHFWKWNTGALLRADTKTTYEALSGAVRGMILTINEARAVIDMPPIDGGDKLMNPATGIGTVTNDTADGTGGASGTPDSPDATGDAGAAARLQAVITARLRDLAAVERKRVDAIAGKPDAETRMDAFYDGWLDTLIEALNPMVPADVSAETLATHWCAESRRDPTGCLADRAARLAAEICGGGQQA